MRLAPLVTEALNPAPIVAGLLLLVAWRSAPTPAEALAWGVAATVFGSLLPLDYILRGARRRRVTDHHVNLREQRPLPLLVAIAAALAGLGLLAPLGALRDVVALVGAMAAELLASILVTLFWKVSIHSAVIAGAMVILVLVLGPALLALATVVPLVGWARGEVGDHTPAQVGVGSVLGALVAAIAFPLLR